MVGERQVRAGGRNRERLGLVIAVVLALTVLTLSFGSNAAPVAITVPFSSTPVADVDLDGDPATGAWADALSAVVPLENGEVPPYGSATLYAKHDGTFMYFRIDAQVDVPWTSAAGNHFWLGFEVSPTGTGHHGGSLGTDTQ